MKKILTLCVMLVGIITCSAQTVIDNFNVGPYIVDYNGQGDVKYRLRDNINLYEFFELQKDTVIVLPQVVEEPVKHAMEVALFAGSNLRYSPMEYGIEAIWKQLISKNVYFNAGLSADFNTSKSQRTIFELGVPLQIEFGKLNHEKASLFGSIGIAPTFYATTSASEKILKADGKKKSGFMITPVVEFGGNIPLGSIIMRIGVYGRYKFNCSSKDVNVCNQLGHLYFGAKIGLVL